MKRMLLIAGLVLAGCSQLPTAGSGYNPSPPNDPNGNDVSCDFSGYNVASGRFCGDSSVVSAAKRKVHGFGVPACRSGYIIAYDENGQPECVPQ